ncbi:FkbM family methyltransferase [Helicobacter canis]|uniref:FkbM family methyltransferase n=1 Tax=Helicobacter canis TaxID=29419 RepID=UPI000E0EEE16|nr:FkbM family methyltransferase [Helicobacter canis]
MRDLQSHDSISTILESKSGTEITKQGAAAVSLVNPTASDRGETISLLLQRGCERMTPLEILNFKHYERLDSAMIFTLVRVGDLVLDIGGNIGYYSIALAKMKHCIIHAFEPVASTYKQFIANAYYNGVQDRVHINNFGLFDKSGELTFYVYKQDFGNASAAIMHEEKENEKIICKVERLDWYVKEQGLTRIDFIKLDVEGAEIFALRGGLESIEKFKPILFVEMLRKWAAKYGYHPNEIIAMLEQIGYMCYFTKEQDCVGDSACGLESTFQQNPTATPRILEKESQSSLRGGGKATNEAIHKGKAQSADSSMDCHATATALARNDSNDKAAQSRIALVRLEQMTEDTTQTNFFFLHKEKHKAYIDRFSLESSF